MSRPQVIVDVDGVLNTLIKDTLGAYTISTGKTLDYNSLTTYHIEDSLSPDDAAVIRQIFLAQLAHGRRGCPNSARYGV